MFKSFRNNFSTELEGISVDDAIGRIIFQSFKKNNESLIAKTFIKALTEKFIPLHAPVK